MNGLIKPKSVRYIKLGEGGAWEADCIKRGIARFGFWTGAPETMAMCRDKRWDDLRKKWHDPDAKGSEPGRKSLGTATRYANETRLFFEDSGETLWVTFFGDKLYWCFLEPGYPEPFGDGESSFRRVRSVWNCHDVKGEPLVKTNLSGAITKVAAYRGTTCKIDSEGKLVDRINALKNQSVETALSRYNKLSEAVLPLVQSLDPTDFETLVGLIFATSGWRRITPVGGLQKTTDFDLELPSTGERAFVQVKSKTNQKTFNDYIELMKDTSYDKMFFVHHTGDVRNSEKGYIFLVDGLAISKMTVDAGLTDWVIRKAS